MSYALQVKGIRKAFGSVKANDGIDLAVRAGEIHAICGENGAGKSTLVGQLGGMLQPDEGEIIIGGKPELLVSAKEASRAGIGVLHQHFMLVEAFTALENIMLGAEPPSRVFLDSRGGEKEVGEICRKYGLGLDLKAKVSGLSVGAQQRIEIIKILYRGARIIILDEPTAVLTPQETESLFAIMRDLKQGGCAVLFISHKLKEVMDIADQVTVIRDGRTVGAWPIREVNEQFLASSMVGREVALTVKREEGVVPGKPVLELQGLTVKTGGLEQGARDISFHICEGEIFGVIGIAGNGQEALVEGILGIRKAASGRIVVEGSDVTNRIPKDYRTLSIGCIASDRLKEGLVKDFSVKDNAYLGYQRYAGLRRGPFLSGRRLADWTRSIVENYRVKTESPDTPITGLSGGNQQKLIIGRELSLSPKLLVAVQPTRGVDVGSIEFIHRNLLRHRNQGNAVLLVSQELEEVLSLSDRIGVLCGGQLMGIGRTEDFTKGQIGLMMAGVHHKGEAAEYA
ncbi:MULTISPECIES: ABC transporter ATP-binding protein [unclassified Paenibacillus]|uniref:ABC transporter ATP-binding protein n=1 Tax=unclassified Paenibacillus TaxID=185978 RepID=UPI00240603FE|nr:MULTISPECIES: ABC transporter ATP-binding protein [unclassified Paenibacillus]MDF9843799.1 ABC-type uncharacterized transport system ATPase subunit [Paenibacillus sp. PastF-2]MDF9850362.1 ABC-type uncharacterized transport system ATPase subunit [Paenibacillus sp. PastM-2]MDF9856935.1 ABC-type uncharacterized transport system ATPase subunit [Paenibacillus sp. PastF-1]MDH6482208.1 ABC-type uncharacterized transport system ATPase subunit [Paenibacillus sp. PastH-2]MDH6509628.1 ABC-type unchara